MKNNYLLPKIFGSVAISAVMIIGVYVLIIDLPNKTNQSNTVVSEQTQTKVAEKTTALPSSQTTTPIESSTSQTTQTSTTSNTNTSNSTSGSTTTTPTVTPSPSYSYNPGTYTKSDTYKVKGFTWTLTANVIIDDKDTITSVSTSQPTSGESLQYYNDFKSELGSAVNGKKIDPLNVGILGGASYTSAAFNAILSLVRSAAKK